MWPNNNKKFTLVEVQRLVPEAFESVTTKMWTSFVDHVIKIELEYWEKDGIVEDVVKEFTLHFDEEYDTDDDDDDDDSNDNDNDESDEYDDDGVEMDDDDKQLIEPELEKNTECHTTTNQVPDSLLSDQDFLEFLESVLPLPDG